MRIHVKKLANRTAEERERFNLEQRIKHRGKLQTEENRRKKTESQRLLYRAKKKSNQAKLQVIPKNLD